jgi:hypothetical protein
LIPDKTGKPPEQEPAEPAPVKKEEELKPAESTFHEKKMVIRQRSGRTIISGGVIYFFVIKNCIARSYPGIFPKRN